MVTKKMSAKRFRENFDQVLGDISRTQCQYRITKNGRALVMLRPVEPSDLRALASATRRQKKKKAKKH